MHAEFSNSKNITHRNKLGLALAGGGFRASLFHLGVLRRMAELDLLRSVEVLSTVSGGSIIGALYILLLKKRFAEKLTLTRDDYIEIIDTLDRMFIAGVKKNLRTLLFMNPFGLFRVFISSYSLGKRMSRLYERYIYRSAVNDLLPKNIWSRLWRPGKYPLKDILITSDSTTVIRDIESYNSNAVSNNNSVITTLILNATSLNSGVPFRFSGVEIGDPVLGFFRYDEISELQKRRNLLFNIDLDDLKSSLKDASSSTLEINDIQYDLKMVSLIDWWRRRKNQPEIPAPTEWSHLYAVPGFPGAILTSEFGLLRDMKLAAWHLRVGSKMSPPITGGLEHREHREIFWTGFRKVYAEQSFDPEQFFRNDDTLFDLLLDFVLELYYLRSAEVMSRKIKKHYESLTIGEAVGASACFPPVFSPFITHDFYNDAHVSRLGLTDGGVYDNIGMSSLFAERCNYIIVSDTGGLLVVKQQSAKGRIGMLSSIVGIMQNDIAETQKEVLRERRNSTERIASISKSIPAATSSLNSSDLRGLAFFHIKSSPLDGKGLMPDIDRNLLAMLRTDLDGFGDVEIAALVNHGYDTADQYLRRYFTGSPYENNEFRNSLPQLPKKLCRSTKDVNNILRVGQSRFFRSLQLYAPVSIIFAVVAIFSLAMALWEIQLSVKDIIMWMAKISLGSIEFFISFLGKGWTQHRISMGMSILFCVFITISYVIFKPLLFEIIKFLKDKYLQLFSKLSTIYKWTRSLSGNVGWIFGLYPPLLISICSLFAWSEYIFFYLPFKSMTKNK